MSKSIYNREYAASHREIIAARKRAARLANPEKAAAAARKYQLANSDKINARKRAFRLANPERVAAWKDASAGFERTTQTRTTAPFGWPG